MECKTIEPAKEINNCLLFIHGLGQTNDIPYTLFEQLKLQNPKVFEHTLMLFPLAPVEWISWNMGCEKRSWFDIKGMPHDVKSFTIDDSFPIGTSDNPYFGDDDYKRSLEKFTKLIATTSGKYQLSTEQFVVGGFSQGSALSLGMLWYAPFKLGGIVALSGFAVIMDYTNNVKEKSKNIHTPVFIAHGIDDINVPLDIGRHVIKYHTQLLSETLDPQQITYKEYSGLKHDTNEQELKDIVEFLKQIFTDHHVIL